MSDPHSATDERRRRRRPRRFLWSLLFVLMVAQFPVPVIHSHEGTEHFSENFDIDRQLAHHLMRHHGRGDDGRCDQWHLHLLMPWEFGGEDGDCERRIPSSMGMWGNVGSVGQCSQSAEHIVRFVAKEPLLLYAESNVPSDGFDTSDGVRFPINFLTTHVCGSCCALLCVWRC